MADVFSTTTTHTKFIPEVWSKDAQIARQSTLVMADLVTRYDFDVANYGSKINIPFVSNLVGGDISTATGQLDAEAPTETEVELVVNKWKGVRMKVLDLVLAQSKYPFRKLYMDRMGYRLGQFLEQDLTALAPALSQTVGAFAVDLVDANYRRAVQYLDDARVPFPDRHLLLSPAQKNAILGIDKFIRYDATGERSMVEIGRVPGEIYGALTHVSPETYITAGNTSNMLFHRAAFACAVQKGIKLEQFAKVGWLDDLGGSHLYGVIELRDDHGVELRS
jgi:hypothetical protein